MELAGELDLYWNLVFVNFFDFRWNWNRHSSSAGCLISPCVSFVHMKELPCDFCFHGPPLGSYPNWWDHTNWLDVWLRVKGFVLTMFAPKLILTYTPDSFPFEKCKRWCTSSVSTAILVPEMCWPCEIPGHCKGSPVKRAPWQPLISLILSLDQGSF